MEEERPRRRRSRRWLLLLVALGAGVWFAPQAVVLTGVRDWPLGEALAGIDGRVSSRAATWSWIGPVDFRDVVLSDRTGRPVAAARRIVVDRGLARMILEGGNPGTVRVVGGEALVEVRAGGSTLEDVIAPWLAGTAKRPAPDFEIEVVDAAVEVVDTLRDEAWRITELTAVGSVRGGGALTPGAGAAGAGGPTLAGWTVAGRIVPGGRPRRDLAAAFAAPAPGATATAPARLDRTTIVAGATATLARAGGWSVSSPEEAVGGETRGVAVAANALPLAASRVVATRFELPRVLDGEADLRLDLRVAPAEPARGLALAGTVTGRRLSLCRADSLAPLLAIEQCEAPLDVVSDGTSLVLRDCRVRSPLFRAEASGRVGLPRGTAWEWGETLIGDDFALAADVDLAALARGVTGGLLVRPDVRVTAGQLQVAAVSRSEGTERVLEARVGSRDLEVLQGARTLRFGEPFVAWLRGRRGAGRSERMRVEEARVATTAVEVTASGSSEASELQWTVDLGRLWSDVGEVLDLRGVAMAGTTRGRVVVERAPATGAVTASLTGGLTGFRWAGPGRPEWTDDEVSIEARAAGTFSGGTMIVDDARLDCAAGEDRLEATLAGGALVDPWSILAALGPGRPARGGIGAASLSAGIEAQASLQGDLARWQARAAALAGRRAIPAVALGGSVRASAAFASQGERWQVTRAQAEVEKLSVDGGRVEEPRLVATAAGTIDPASGRIDVSSAEMLTATVSLRTGGLTILPAPAPGGSVVERLRGRAQWQFDVGRVESWGVGADVAGRWPASGRVWGTFEIQDTPAGLNLLLDATASQLSLARTDDPAAPPRPVWEEPRARLLVEVTRGPAGDTLAVDRMTLESSTVATAAAGTIRDWSTRPQLDVGGTMSYDWSLLSRLLQPWTGGRLELAGGAARPFLVRGPVEPLVAALERAMVPTAARPPAAVAPAETVEIPLPESWLAPVRGGGREADPARPVRATLPVSMTPPGRAADAAAWLRALSVETSTNWAAGAIDGVALDAGETALRLFEGQLALGPFDVGFGGGRIRGAPWVQLLPSPGEIVVPSGRVVDSVVLAGPLADSWVTWMFPLIGRSTRTRGLVSVDVAGARLPLADPGAGEAAGQIVFERLEVTPGPLLAPLANLVVKLQSVVDPRFAFGDKAVLLRVRPDPVRFRLTGGRLWHDGLLLDMGQLVLRSAGSVGHDGTLAMMVEVGLRGDLVAGAPRLAKLVRTPMVIPVAGTVERPQFDGPSMEKLLARVVDNTAEAVIRDGFERSLEGLEELFGNPPPRAPSLPPPAPVPTPATVPAPPQAPPPLNFP